MLVPCVRSRDLPQSIFRTSLVLASLVSDPIASRFEGINIGLTVPFLDLRRDLSCRSNPDEGIKLLRQRR